MLTLHAVYQPVTPRAPPFHLAHGRSRGMAVALRVRLCATFTLSWAARQVPTLIELTPWSEKFKSLQSMKQNFESQNVKRLMEQLAGCTSHL
jgi:hypothetical protein